MKAKESFGDGPVALATLARVERAQCQNMEFPELIWHPRKGPPGERSLSVRHNRLAACARNSNQRIERQSQGIDRGGSDRHLGEPE